MSDKPLIERLQVKRGRTLAVVDAPGELGGAFGEAVMVPADEADVVLVFAGDRARLDAWLANALATLRDAAILWVAYPKLSSALAGDLSRDVIHRLAPGHGLDTVSQIAVDATWSALRLKRVG